MNLVILDNGAIWAVLMVVLDIAFKVAVVTFIILGIRYFWKKLHSQ